MVGVIVGRTNSETITKKAGSVAAKRRRGKLEEWVPFLTILTTRNRCPVSGRIGRKW